MKTLLALAAALIFCHAAWSAELFGRVDSIVGSADITDQSGTATPVIADEQIYEGQTINSGPDGEVQIVTEDGGMLAIRPNTTFRVDEYKADGDASDKIFMSLLKGAVRSITGWIGKHNSSAYRISTPNATIGVRGTDHETVVIDSADGDQAGTYDTVNDGETVIDTKQGKTEVTPGKFAFAPRGGARAPYFLAKRPMYFERRKLRNEKRIAPRKAYLRKNFERFRTRRIQRVKEMRGKRLLQRKSNAGPNPPAGKGRADALKESRGTLGERLKKLGDKEENVKKRRRIKRRQAD